MAVHRYWRVWLTRSTTQLRVSELVLRTVSGGSQEATGGTALASQSDGTNVPSRAFDGSSSTFWNPTASTLPPDVPCWIGYDLGSGNAKDIVEYEVTCDPSLGISPPDGGYLQYSDDGVSWFTVSAGFKTGGTLGTYTAPVLGLLAAPKGRGVRGRLYIGWPNPSQLQKTMRGSRGYLDYVDGGAYKIIGDVKVKGTPDTAVARRVVLLTQENMRVVRQTWSRSSDGYYEFQRIKNQKYVVVTLDYTGTYRAVCADQITPEAM